MLMVREITVQRNRRASAVSAVVVVVSLVAAVLLGASTSTPAVPFDLGSDTPALMTAATAVYSVLALSLVALGWHLGRAWSAAIGGSALPTLSTLAGAIALCAFLALVILFGEASNNEGTSTVADQARTLTTIAIAALSTAIFVVGGLLALRRGARPAPALQPH
jgi:hypothetical protein